MFFCQAQIVLLSAALLLCGACRFAGREAVTTSPREELVKTQPVPPPASAAANQSAPADRNRSSVSTGTDNKTVLSYAVQLVDEFGGAQPVSTSVVFRSGERFRLLLQSSVRARPYLYYLDRQGVPQRLYPVDDVEPPTLLSADKLISLPAADRSTFYRMDQVAGEERLVLLVVPPENDSVLAEAASSDAAAFEALVSAIERAQSNCTRTVPEGAWTRLSAVSDIPANLAFAARIRLQHQ